MSRTERVALALGSIGFVLALMGASSCASVSDTARKSVVAAYQVASAARTSLDSYDAQQQAALVGEATGSVANVEIVKTKLIAYRAKRDKVAAAIDLFYSAISTAGLAVTAVDAKETGAEANLTSALVALYQQAMNVKAALETLGLSIGGI